LLRAKKYSLPPGAGYSRYATGSAVARQAEVNKHNHREKHKNRKNFADRI